jgi:hypothetical protein
LFGLFGFGYTRLSRCPGTLASENASVDCHMMVFGFFLSRPTTFQRFHK